MAWTTPSTIVTGDTIVASWANTYVRDNTAYLKGLLDGTGGAVGVTVPNKLTFYNDAQFYADATAYPGTNPRLNFDTNDYFYYYRSGDQFAWVIATINALTIDGNGKLTGAGFFDSGEVSISATSYLTVNHGLPARPRFVAAWGSTGSGGADGKTLPFGMNTQIPANELTINDVNSTRVYLYNGYGATRYANVYCML